MKLSIKLCFALGALILLFSCKKTDPEIVTSEIVIPQGTIIFPDSTVDVYMVGFYGDSTDASGNHIPSIATYWKNNTPVMLTDEQTNAKAYAITVSGNDIYVAGYKTINGIRVATYWKNGTAVMLSSGVYSGEATSIVVSGNDVYVSGFENSIPRYWKNGIETILSSDATKNTNVSGLYVVGADVYACGNEWEPSIGSGVIWKNGAKISVDSTNVYRSVVVNGNDIYITGYRKRPSSSNSLYPVYWYNGSMVSLDTIRGVTMGVAIAGNDIYVVGWRNADQAIYWKNGILFDLPSDYKGTAKKIDVYNNNSYVVGDMDNKGIIWINGNQFDIGEYTRLFDVKVVPK